MYVVADARKWNQALIKETHEPQLKGPLTTSAQLGIAVASDQRPLCLLFLFHAFVVAFLCLLHHSLFGKECVSLFSNQGNLHPDFMQRPTDHRECLGFG